MTNEPLTRDAWVEIDLDAIRHNMQVARRCVGDGPIICAVVKADGYGHGALRTARTAIEAGAGYLAVATVEEAVELRDGGVRIPILMLSEPPIRAIPTVLENNILPTVTTLDFALEYGKAAEAAGREAPYHLKLNTGMNRIGIHYTEAIEFLHAISVQERLRLKGVFTHFATADTNDDWEFRRQLQRFDEAVSAMRLAGIDPGIVHCANTATVIRYPRAAYDMVRFGIGLYGLHPSTVTYASADLRPAMSVIARVTHVKEPAVGEGVSYGLVYRSPGNVQIATIPIGYADGLRRSLSDKMNVIYKGHIVPQVGRICMDQCMFEVPMSSGLSLKHPIPPVQIGDEVVIVGERDGSKITLDMLASKLGTINYELACGFGMRLPRVYL